MIERKDEARAPIARVRGVNSPMARSSPQAQRPLRDDGVSKESKTVVEPVRSMGTATQETTDYMQLPVDDTSATDFIDQFLSVAHDRSVDKAIEEEGILDRNPLYKDLKDRAR